MKNLGLSHQAAPYLKRDLPSRFLCIFQNRAQIFFSYFDKLQRVFVGRSKRENLSVLQDTWHRWLGGTEPQHGTAVNEGLERLRRRWQWLLDIYGSPTFFHDTSNEAKAKWQEFANQLQIGLLIQTLDPDDGVWIQNLMTDDLESDEETKGNMHLIRY